MATQKPRITITLERDVYDTIRGLSEVQGVTMSGLVSDFLTMVNPVQQRVLRACQKAKALSTESRAGMVSSLESGEAQLNEMMGPLFALLDQLADGQPPHSNTGVTNPHPPTKSNGETPAKAKPRAASSHFDAAQKHKNTKTQKHRSTGVGK